MFIKKLGNWWTQPYFGMVVAAFPTLNPPEIKMKHYIAKIAVVILSGFAVASRLRAGPSADDVGDAETFGHPHFTWARPAASSHCPPIRVWHRHQRRRQCQMATAFVIN
jgi:hypothetical protein